jgi:hypothetical protein
MRVGVVISIFNLVHYLLLTGCKSIYKGTYVISLSCLASLGFHATYATSSFPVSLRPFSVRGTHSSSQPRQFSKGKNQRSDLIRPMQYAIPNRKLLAPIRFLRCWTGRQTKYMPTLIARKQDIPQPRPKHQSQATSSVSYHFKGACAATQLNALV